eukprot:5855243-Prymnesium_polylepis.1
MSHRETISARGASESSQRSSATFASSGGISSRIHDRAAAADSSSGRRSSHLVEPGRRGPGVVLTSRIRTES